MAAQSERREPMDRRAVRTVVVVLVVSGASGDRRWCSTSTNPNPWTTCASGPMCCLSAADFVLVSESYSPGAMRALWSRPPPRTRLPRVMAGLVRFPASAWQPPGWPHGARADPQGNTRIRLCSCGAWHGSGWWGWIRNYRHYEVRLTAWRPGFGQGPMWRLPMVSLVLFPRHDPVLVHEDRHPRGPRPIRSSLIAHRGW